MMFIIIVVTITRGAAGLLARGAVEVGRPAGPRGSAFPPSGYCPSTPGGRPCPWVEKVNLGVQGCVSGRGVSNYSFQNLRRNARSPGFPRQGPRPAPRPPKVSRSAPRSTVQKGCSAGVTWHLGGLGALRLLPQSSVDVFRLSCVGHACPLHAQRWVKLSYSHRGKLRQ